MTACFARQSIITMISLHADADKSGRQQDPTFAVVVVHKLQMVNNHHCLHMTSTGEAHRTQPAESCRSLDTLSEINGLRAHLHKHCLHNNRLGMAGKQTQAVQTKFYR